LGESEALIDPCDAATLAQLVRDESLAAEMRRLAQSEPCRPIPALEMKLASLKPSAAVSADQSYGEDVALGPNSDDAVVDSLA
jgi:hypothetical protein